MLYTPVTTGPISPDELLRIAQQVAQKEDINDDGLIPYYIDQSEDYPAFGLEAAIRDEDFDPDSVASLFSEDPNLRTLEIEDEYRDQARDSFFDALTEYADTADLSAPYNEVQAQIAEETNAFTQDISVDWSEAIAEYRAGVQNFLDESGLSQDEAEHFASTGYLREDTLRVSDYTILRGRAIIDDVIENFGGMADIVDILAYATDEDKDTVEEELGDDFEHQEELLEDVNINELAEAYAVHTDSDSYNDVVLY